jgi:hypothetical protein
LERKSGLRQFAWRPRPPLLKFDTAQPPEENSAGSPAVFVSFSSLRNRGALGICLTGPPLLSLPPFTFQKTLGYRILRSPRSGTGTAPRFAKSRGGGFSMERGGFKPCSSFSERRFLFRGSRRIFSIYFNRGGVSNRPASGPAPGQAIFWIRTAQTL